MNRDERLMNDENTEYNSDTVMVVVYGTLKKGDYNHSYMKSAQSIYHGMVISKEKMFRMVSVGGSFPAIVSGDKRFIGELYEVPVQNIDILDALEGYPTMYNRGEFEFLDMNGNSVNALTYYLSGGFIEYSKSSPKTSLQIDCPRIWLDDDCYTWLIS